MRGSPLLLVLLVVAAGLPVAASAGTDTRLENTTPPTIDGTFRQGSTLTASTGSWSFTPSTYAYQWQRCDSDGSGCNDIAHATAGTYVLAAADVTHTLDVVVTASNAFSTDSATSDPSPIVSSANGPAADVQPAISGTAQVGQTLSVSNGTWIPAASTFAYQWQLCASDGSDCLNITGATKQTFKLTSDDAAHTLRALVTAQTAGGDVATAHSNTTGKVPGGSQGPAPTTSTGPSSTTTPGTTTPASGRRPPTLTILRLHRSGKHVVAALHICNGSGGAVTLVNERVSKGKTRAQTHRFTVNVTACSNLTRSWAPPARFHGAGRLVVTIQAEDQTGTFTKSVKSSLAFR
jgi:hypothetical protein